MDELRAIMHRVAPGETLLVVDSMIGQEALHVAEGFRDNVSITGLILTKMDGDARGGAAISIRSVTGVPIKYLGTGEKLDAIEAFEPSRLASRILGMGDVLGLIEKAEVAFDERTAREQTEKMVSGKFDLEDFVSQLRAVKKMGPITQLLEMLPGDMGRLAKQVDPQEAERNMRMTEAIISSMTRQERHDPDLLNASRRRRIAAGSGTDVQEVNRLLKQFREAQKMMKTLQRTGGKGLGRLFG
jgi:signal recognition particle subunit SRP54